MNAALRNLLAKFPPGRSPFPTSLGFYAELRAATPSATHDLLKDLFEEITFWDLRAHPPARGSIPITSCSTGSPTTTRSWLEKVDATDRLADLGVGEFPSRSTPL